jgi:hypothetical protein
MSRLRSNAFDERGVARVRPAVLALALASVACDDALVRVDLIANLRVLGARVETAGEPERASPAPGEMASIRWLAVDPRPDPLLGWAFAICPAAPPGSNLPSCAGDPFATAIADVPVAGEPRVDFEVPSAIDSRALAVFGVVCPSSAPTLTGEAFDCEGPGGRLVSLDFELGSAEYTNLNPVIEADALSLDGTSIPPGRDCTTLPSVATSSSHTLELALRETDRDAVDPEISGGPPKETLQVSHFVTAGSLERAFTVFEANVDDLRTRVTWKAPKSVPPDGFVRLYFVVRDLRGGSDFIERAVCIEE